MALPAIADELLVDIFLRLPTPEDLIRASAACVSFRRLVADRSFLRRFRKLHPPPLLGFLDPNRHCFHPAVPPHPSAPPASAVASAADFSFDFLPGSSRDWSVLDVRDGRVLLSRPRRAGKGLNEMVVCDPLHRQYLLLPELPDDLVASWIDTLVTEGPRFSGSYRETFLVSPCDDEEAAATEETSFRVIWMTLLQTKPMAAVFSSGTGQWRAIPPLTRSESLPGFVLSTWMVSFVSRHYANGRFYWISGSTEKLLVLDIRRMEFSMTDHPPCVRGVSDDVAIAEAGQGMTVMFVPKPNTPRFTYSVWRNNGGSSTQWQTEEKTISLDYGSLIMGAVGRHLLLYRGSFFKPGYFTQDVNTFELERVCDALSRQAHGYCNFPPSLLSSPTV
ncbi:hypothetical protein CFC21_003896 [Triticum aestivum]|uniref:F-box domain-containing protein n=2 Tax=Triticum TaxID=4564 RepID=A0A9R0QG10_TRITD|nr:hypothetical protein CFC21_003896 [Triticum aestivum]VAH10876.1 unnamed protein product [Triticum turgidum subsp. durum]